MTGADRSRKRALAAAAGGIGALALLVPALVLAQSAPTPGTSTPPPRLVFQLGTTLSSHSNYDLSTTARHATTLDGNFGLTYTTVTRLSSFRLNVAGLLRASSDGSLTGTGFRQPSAELAWSRVTPDAKFSLGARYTRTRTSDTTSYYLLPDGSLSPDPLVSSGTVSVASTSLSFETGLRAPVGFALTGNAMNRHYNGAVGTDAYDSRTRRSTATMKLRPGQTIEYSLGLSYSHESDDNILQTRRRSTGIFAGMQRSTDGLTLDTQLGYQRSVTDQIAPFGTQVSTGLYGSVGLTRDLPTGNIAATLDSARDNIGLRNTLSIGILRKTRDGSQLSAKVGLAARPRSNAQVVGNLTYAGKLPDASYSLAFDRSVSLNANNVDVAYTRLTAGYTHKISQISSLGLDLSVSRVSGAGYGTYGPATSRQSLALSFNRDLTADWQLSAGLKHLHQSSSSGPATDNSAFLTIKRSFTLLP